MNEQKIIEEWNKFMLPKAGLGNYVWWIPTDKDILNYWLKVISDERARLVEEIEKINFSFENEDFADGAIKMKQMIIYLIKNNG